MKTSPKFPTLTKNDERKTEITKIFPLFVHPVKGLEVMQMTNEQQEKIIVLLKLGIGYHSIVHTTWTTTNHLLSTPENTKRLLKALEDVKAGKVIKRDPINKYTM